jgi:hypothetical protein
MADIVRAGRDMKRAGDNCLRCKFFHRDIEDGGGVGLCLRYPPRQCEALVPRETGAESVYPEVFIYWWCGEFQPQAGA